MQVSKKITALAAAAVLTVAGMAQANPTVTLSITASGGTYSVYATDSASDNAGIADFGLSITGSNGLTVSTSTLRAPQSSYTDSINGVTTDGFNSLRNSGTAGQGLTASQGSLVYAGSNDPMQDQNVFQGVGQVALSGGRDVTDSDPTVTTPDHDNASWSYPVLLATGKYTGTAGTLTADATAGQFFQVLNGTGPGTWSGPGNISNADTVPGSVTLGTPEPGSLALLSFGGLGLLARRRKA